MREWLEPVGAHFGAGLNIAQDGIAYGNVAIYRSLEEGDFSDLDMAVLGVVNEHLCTCFANLFPMGLQSGDFSAESSELAARDHLTPREEELVAKVGLGVARRDLASELFISENTVKRHLNSVYGKCGVRGFDELARRCAAEQSPDRTYIVITAIPQEAALRLLQSASDHRLVVLGEGGTV